jgi:3-deoxy-manno-octulosonate cytidylyltransferase (CMP-KDO synthetase)
MEAAEQPTETIAIVIPARYGSTRLPGKPLIEIAGETLLSRVIKVARNAKKLLSNYSINIFVATDDDRIAEHALNCKAASIMTPSNCATGTDRIYAAIQNLTMPPQIIINLQGDAPLTAPEWISSLIISLLENKDTSVATVATSLTWTQLDKLRQQKQITPFSGTTVTIDQDQQALWFSKNIIPAIRQESTLRQNSHISPILKHVGLYGYRYNALERYISLPTSHYENLEGLEQLRWLENNFKIKVVLAETNTKYANPIGVDSMEDVYKVEQFLSENQLA